MPAATLTPDGRQSAKDTAESVKITVDGADLGEDWLGMLLDVHIRDNLLLPDMAHIRFRDPDGSKVRNNVLKLGAALAVRLGSDTDRTPAKLFEGEIVALEPEFHADEVILAARAFDKGHRLNRTKESHTYINMKAEDIVRQVAGRARVQQGTIDSTTVVHAHLQQSQETDWDLCWRLARMNGFEVSVGEGKLNFHKRATGSAACTLKWRESLYSFRPRASAVGQVSEVTVNSHDPKAKQATTGTATSARSSSSSPPAIFGQRSKAVAALNGGKALVADRVATSTSEAKSMAEASLARNASAFVEAEGVAKGSPLLKAGATVKLEDVGDFSGEYAISASTHIFRGGGAYTTKFEITGERPRSITALAGGGGAGGTGGGGGGGGGAKSTWSAQLVIGKVSNNNDPDGMGRVKVEFSSLGSNMESEWARVATLNAGSERGIFMLPQPGDEVVVGFEHGDTRRPFVLGSLYTGTEKLPADLKDGDGRKSKAGIKTDHQFLAHSEKELKLHSSEKMTIEIKGNPGTMKTDADGDIEVKGSKNLKTTAGQNFEVSANSSVKIKGSGSVEIESSGQLKVKGSTVSIEGSGMVEIKGASIKLG
jgi:phage protein D/phage baseplate assembly protein gpV